jgi:hypothetical protein
MQADSWSRHQLDHSFGYSLRRFTPLARQPTVVRRRYHHLPFATSQAMLGNPVLLMENAHPPAVQTFPDRDRLADIVGHRVAIAAVADEAVLGDLAMADVAGVVIRPPCDRQQMFLRPTLHRHSPRGGVHPAIDLLAPLEGLPVQIRQRREAQPFPVRNWCADIGSSLPPFPWSPAGPGAEVPPIHLRLFPKLKLLILDEMGYLGLDAFAATCLFQLVSERYEKGSIILTSNKS